MTLVPLRREGLWKSHNSGNKACSAVPLIVVLVLVLTTAIVTQRQGINIIPMIMTGEYLDELKFVEYVPSVLEQKWFQDRNMYGADPSKICQALAEQADALSLWVSITGNTSPSGSLFGPYNATQDELFSKLVYVSPQTNKKHVRVIEPLVGHLRHPYALPHCKPDRPDAVHVQDRSYIAFAGLTSWEPHLYPGKKYLFDLGTADFETSLKYMIGQYEGMGIHFDRIWAWEVTAKPAYWDTVTENIQGKLHFYNKPVSADVKSPAHPLQILKSIYKAGDYAVVKLDIDNSELEMSIMDEVRRDEELKRIIGEMMFEMHYDSRDMQRYFRRPNMSYTKTVETFRSYREMGIPLHYWP
eukprot:jgi/Picsp_1/4655/NSC_02025-R1_protein